MSFNDGGNQGRTHLKEIHTGKVQSTIALLQEGKISVAEILGNPDPNQWERFFLSIRHQILWFKGPNGHTQPEIEAALTFYRENGLPQKLDIWQDM